MLDDADIPEPPDPRIARTETQLCRLRTALELGMQNAELATRRARVVTEAMEAGAEPPKGVDPGDVFARLFRGVRIALMLETRLDDDLFALRAGTYVPEPRRAPHGSRAADPHDPPAKPERDRMARRSQVRGYVLELVDPDSFEEEECERIYEQLTERIYESDRYDAFLDLPLEQAVDAICKDLGVRPQYELWEGLSWPPWRQNPPQPAPPPASAPPPPIPLPPPPFGVGEPERGDSLAMVESPPRQPP